MKGMALVAWNVRKIRVRRGITQEALAAAAAVERAYLGSLERRSENPTVDLLDRIAEALEVPLAELFRKPAVREREPAKLTAGRKPASRIK